MRSLKKLAICATTWLVIGLLGGVFSREFTKAHDVTAWTQLKVVHTHSLALGFMLTLIVLLVERAFALSHHRGAFAFLGIQPWPPADDRNARRARHDTGQRTSRRFPCDLRYCGSRPHRPVRRSRRPHGGPVHITSNGQKLGTAHDQSLTLKQAATTRHIAYISGHHHDGSHGYNGWRITPAT